MVSLISLSAGSALTIGVEAREPDLRLDRDTEDNEELLNWGNEKKYV